MPKAFKHQKRSYGRRFVLSLFPCLLLSFMYCVWGGMEVYVGNTANFRFTYAEASLPLWGMCALASLAGALITALFRGKAFRFVRSLLFAVAVASYLQNVFLNLDLGLLEGEGTDWSLYTQHGYRNIGVWALVIVLLVGMLMLLRVKTARAIVTYGCTALLAVQLITFCVVSAQHLSSDADRTEEPVYILSGETQYDVSAEGNVIVFLLDYFSNDYIDSMLKQFPNALDAFRDFTYYDNCDPCYIGTFPSVVHMLTGYDFDNTVPIETWLDSAWNSESAQYFYRTLRENGYDARFFDSSNNYFGISYAEPYFSNLQKLSSERTVRYNRVARNMLRLSAYRYLPHMFKKHFELSSFDLSGTVALGNADAVNSLNRTAFYYTMVGNGLKKIENDGKYFIIEFLRGTHPPYHINELIGWDDNATLEQCAAGYMKIVAGYLQQLKDLGLYDDATIIVTSDHGDKENSMQVMYFIKEKGVTREKMAVNSAPISHDDFLGTVLHNIGAEHPYGTSIYDFAEGEKRERTVMRNFIDTSYPAVPKYMSTAKGTHTVMYAYTYKGDRKDLRKQIRRGPTQILPLTESFN